MPNASAPSHPTIPALQQVLANLHQMEERGIWPNGTRYLWTDAFGVVLLLSLYQELGKPQYLDEAEWVVAEVDRILGRARGIRIGQAPERDGQYFHYLMMWVFALTQLGKLKAEYRRRAIRLVRQIHPAFVVQGQGVRWKMTEDLSQPYPGYGFGALDPFHGYVVYRLLDPEELAPEIAELAPLIEHSYRDLVITQDLGLGMMLWFSHFFPTEPWARVQRSFALATLDSLWIHPPGYFCRDPLARRTRFAFTNYGIALGLAAVQAYPDRVARLLSYFQTYRSGDHYDDDAITHVMACSAHFPGKMLVHDSGQG